jgi:agmatinase
MTFNPNATGNKNLGVFSLPFVEEEAKLIFIPIPWEVTTSYGHGCSLGPAAILEASKQLDLFDALYGEFYKLGIFQKSAHPDLLKKSQQLKVKALEIRDKLEMGEELNSTDINTQELINQASKDLNQELYLSSKKLIEQNKLCAVIGGDHSSPFGLVKALSEKHKNLSIIHVDAHLDLRKAYQGYTYSHASIMYNIMNELNPTSLVQLGIRDFCPEEFNMSRDDKRIHTYYDSQVSLRLAMGESWESLCYEAIGKLSDNVYISFDIDGLSPDLCPQTGTPVPGGLSFQQMEILLYLLSKSHKKIVGFDLCEVSVGQNPDSLDCWDSNVGARVLFKLSGAILTNNDSHN